MNPLVDKFPTKIKIDDQILDINTDFRNCLKIILAFEDDNLTIEEKYYIMLMRLYGNIPNNQEEAIRKAIKRLGITRKKRHCVTMSKKKKR